MQSPPTDTPPESGPGKSRLDREIDEILSKDENIRLLPPPPKPARPHAKTTSSTPTMGAMIPPRFQKLITAPIVVALALGVLALLIADLSPLFANLLCLAAVVCIVHPMFQRFRRPTTTPETHMWRGQVIDVRQSKGSSSMDSVREWWKSLKR
jgi:hypothetical protein